MLVKDIAADDGYDDDERQLPRQPESLTDSHAFLGNRWRFSRHLVLTLCLAARLRSLRRRSVCFLHYVLL